VDVNVISRVSLVLLIAGLVSCETRRQIQVDSDKRAEADAIVEEPPVIVAQIIELPSSAKVAAARGNCVVSRPGQVGRRLKRGQSFKDGDSVELGHDCVLAISPSEGNALLHLTRENGRFYQIKVLR
jgi:hypothetical protein